MIFKAYLPGGICLEHLRDSIIVRHLGLADGLHRNGCERHRRRQCGQHFAIFRQFCIDMIEEVKKDHQQPCKDADRKNQNDFFTSAQGGNAGEKVRKENQ